MIKSDSSFSRSPTKFHIISLSHHGKNIEIAIHEDVLRSLVHVIQVKWTIVAIGAK